MGDFITERRAPRGARELKQLHGGEGRAGAQRRAPRGARELKLPILAGNFFQQFVALREERVN